MYVRTYVCMYVRLCTYLLICVQNIQARIYRGNMNKLDATEPLSITPGRRGEATQLKLVGVFEAPQPTIPLCESHSTSHITKKKRCSTMQCARNMAEKLKAAIGNPKGFVDEKRMYLYVLVTICKPRTMPWDNSSSRHGCLSFSLEPSQLDTSHEKLRHKSQTNIPQCFPPNVILVRSPPQDFTFSACCLELRIKQICFKKTTCIQILGQIPSNIACGCHHVTTTLAILCQLMSVDLSFK